MTPKLMIPYLLLLNILLAGSIATAQTPIQEPGGADMLSTAPKSTSSSLEIDEAVSSPEPSGAQSANLISSQGKPHKDNTIDQSENDERIKDLLFDLLKYLIGGVTVVTLTLIYWHSRRIMEYRSLLAAFITELILDFERCVTYFRQSKTGEVSFSSIFVLTGASEVARLAAVTNRPEIIKTIMDLKSSYFQVQRHVFEVSKYASEMKRLGIQIERARISGDRTNEGRFQREQASARDSAQLAQGTALAFFKGTGRDNSTYEQVCYGTEAILSLTKQVCDRGKDREFINGLEEKFTQAKIIFQAVTNLSRDAEEPISEEDVEAEKVKLIQEAKEGVNK